jgi:hypothetical protein
MNPLIQLKTTPPLLITITFLCFALLPRAQAVLPSPTPDGGYPNFNTSKGQDALFSLTTGSFNTAVGFDALLLNTGGSFNTALGHQALVNNTMGGSNVAIGVQALANNTIGTFNTATGVQTLFSNTEGNSNTAEGFQALSHNTSSHNTASGFQALFANVSGLENTAIGDQALLDNNGNFNVAVGGAALLNNTTGNENTACGGGALNDTTGNSNIDIGNKGVTAEATTIRIGMEGTHTNAYIAGIYKTTVAKGLTVVVDSTGHLGTKGSSERLKDAIKPMDKVSEAIFALKPVTFHYKKALDPDATPQFGIVAEDVAKVNPDLVVRDENGDIYTVRYDAVNAMLLNEFLKEHRKNEKQEVTIARQQKQIEALTAGLQKVDAQLKMSRPAPQMAEDN